MEVPAVGFAAGLLFGTGCYWCTRGSAMCAGPVRSFEDALGDEGSEFKAKVVEYLQSEIEVAAKSGFQTREEIKAAFEHRIRDEHPRASRAELARWGRVADFYLAQQAAREKTWPRQTTNDRITRAFKDLATYDDVVAVENAGYADDGGWDEVSDVRRGFTKTQPIGAAFYNRRELERAMDGKGLSITFGVFPADKEPDAASGSKQQPPRKVADDAAASSTTEERAKLVGRTVCAALLNRGLLPEWDGKPDHKIKIPPFEWRRRRPRSVEDFYL